MPEMLTQEPQNIPATGFCPEYREGGHLVEMEECSFCGKQVPYVLCCQDNNWNNEADKMVASHKKVCWESLPAILADRPWLSVTRAPEVTI